MLSDQQKEDTEGMELFIHRFGRLAQIFNTAAPRSMSNE